jgi:hypothetical protein
MIVELEALPLQTFTGRLCRLDVYWPLGQLDCERVSFDISAYDEDPP